MKTKAEKISNRYKNTISKFHLPTASYNPLEHASPLASSLLNFDGISSSLQPPASSLQLPECLQLPEILAAR
jgi:hypothetical protein